MLKCLVMPALLIILLLGLTSTLQSAVDSHQTAYTSGASELTEFNASETDNIAHAESNNSAAPLLDAVIEDKGIPLLDIVIEDSGIPLLNIVPNK